MDCTVHGGELRGKIRKKEVGGECEAEVEFLAGLVNIDHGDLAFSHGGPRVVTSGRREGKVVRRRLRSVGGDDNVGRERHVVVALVPAAGVGPVGKDRVVRGDAVLARVR